MSRVGDLVGRLFIGLPTKSLTMATMIGRLEKARGELAARYNRAAGTDAQRARLRHIIGIERWSQRRLRTILGEPPIADEYDGYQPDAALGWPAMREAFATTREETITLARQIADAGLADTVRVRHNDLGELNAREWLYYLNTHANRESLAIR